MKAQIRPLQILVGLILFAGLSLAGWWWLTLPHLPPAEQGRRLAETVGCFACHGPNGTNGAPNPGRLDKTVPTFTGDLMMFASSKDEIREWITDGAPAKRAASKSFQEQREKGVLKMPAFKDRLSATQIDHLVAFVTAVNGMDRPEDSLPLAGYNRAGELGCFSCHGPGGRFARPNQGSFKGYVASWMTSDFTDLVHNRTEFEQWVNEGISERMNRNFAASFFLNRASLKMPPYRSQLQPGDLDALWAYIQWLRTQGA